MRKYLIPSIGILIGLSLISWGISQIKPQAPVYVEYFKAGDTLLPDYSCADTLIVIDAVKLNYDMARIEQGLTEPTDGNIDSIIHTSCIIKP